MRLLWSVLVLATGLAQPALAGWKALAPIESPRSDLCAASLDGELYVAGGRGLRGPSDTFESFDPQANLWRPLPSMPQALSNFGMAGLGGVLYVTGGHTNADRTAPTAAVWIFDPANAKWSRGPDLPAKRASHALVAAGGRLYVLGGEGPGAERVFMLDPAKGAWQVAGGSLPTSRIDPAAAALGSDIYLVGGANSASVDIYDIGKGAWRKGPPLPGPRAGVAIGILGGKVHVTGGQSIQPLKTFAEHLVLDPKSGSWSPAAEMPTPRHGLASAVLNGEWYVVGGGKGAGVFTAFTAADTVEVFQGN